MGSEDQTFGYAGRILKVDLSSRSVTEVPTMDYAGRFLGGRGIAAKIYWDDVAPGTGALDEGNTIVFATGPLCGVPTVGGSRWTVCAKSPEPIPEQFCYGNSGGRWGAELKFSGYDAIAVTGKSEKPAYLLVRDGVAEVKDASALWGKGALQTREILKGELGASARVATIGPAGENLATNACLVSDNDAICTAGMGAVMGSKKLKAIVVTGGGKKAKVARPEQLAALSKYYRESGRTFTEHLARWSRDLMRQFRLVPGQELKKDPCYGCLGRCCRKTYQAADGSRGKFMCHSAYFYQPHAEKYYGKWNEVPFYANRLCNEYGLDAVAIDFIMMWLQGCYKAGIVTDESTGIPISKLGSQEFIEALVKKISTREGFGEVLALGPERAAETLGAKAKEQIELTGYLDQPGYDLYGPRLYLTNALLYAMEPRVPIHQVHEIGMLIGGWVAWARKVPRSYMSSDVVRAIAKRFWGSEIAGDFMTYEGKPLAAKMIQDRQYVKECLILCDYLWPITHLPFTADHVGDPSLESKLLSAVTGIDIDEQNLYRVGERAVNLQRAILIRDGREGRASDTLSERSFTVPLDYDISNPDCIVPGKNGEVASRKGLVVDRAEFEKMKDEFYSLRGWDVATGLQERETLEGLELGDIAREMEQRGLLAPDGQSTK